MQQFVNSVLNFYSSSILILLFCNYFFIGAIINCIFVSILCSSNLEIYFRRITYLTLIASILSYIFSPVLVSFMAKFFIQFDYFSLKVIFKAGYVFFMAIFLSKNIYKIKYFNLIIWAVISAVVLTLSELLIFKIFNTLN